jgi:hypothetical protein
LIKKSIWNLPVTGCEKWFRALETMYGALRVGLERSACTGTQRMPYAEIKSSQSAWVGPVDESEV